MHFDRHHRLSKSNILVHSIYWLIRIIEDNMTICWLRTASRFPTSSLSRGPPGVSYGGYLEQQHTFRQSSSMANIGTLPFVCIVSYSYSFPFSQVVLQTGILRHHYFLLLMHPQITNCISHILSCLMSKWSPARTNHLKKMETLRNLHHHHLHSLELRTVSHFSSRLSLPLNLDHSSCLMHIDCFARTNQWLHPQRSYRVDLC